MEHSVREKPPQFEPSKNLPYSGILIPFLLLVGAIALAPLLKAPSRLIDLGISACLTGTGVLWCIPVLRGQRSSISLAMSGVGISLGGMALGILLLSQRAMLFGGILLLASLIGLGICSTRLPNWTRIRRATVLLDAFTIGLSTMLVLINLLPAQTTAIWLAASILLSLSVLLLMIIPNVKPIWQTSLRMVLLGGLIAATGLAISKLLNPLAVPLVLGGALWAGCAGLNLPKLGSPSNATRHESAWLALLPFFAWGIGVLIAREWIGPTAALVGMLGLWSRIGLALRSQRSLAQQLQTAIGDESQLRLLLAGNAHNIKHPLANIQSYLMYLKSHTQRPPEQAQLIIESTIPPLEENAAILMERIKGMLEIARHAVVPVQCRSVSMSMLYEALHAMVLREQRTSRPPLQATVRCDTDDSLIAWTDIAAVCWCVENLIRNAIQAQRDQAVAIVTVRLAAASAARLVIVEDTGPGFPATVLEAGYASNAEAQDLGGGLGLLGVQATIRQLGATLRLANRTPPVSGAIATIELPMKG